MFDRFLNTSLKLILMFPYYVYHHLFLLFRALLNILEEEFWRNGQWISADSYFPEKSPSQMFGSFLDVFLNSVVMLLYYQYYYSFLFIYFVILQFPCFTILALIALLSELLFCLLWAIFYIILFFLSHPFKRRCLVQIFKNILQYILCCFYVQLLTLNDSMLFYCFNHNFNDIFMVNLFEQ